MVRTKGRIARLALTFIPAALVASCVVSSPALAETAEPIDKLPVSASSMSVSALAVNDHENTRSRASNYTAQQLDASGGDPLVLEYWTDERLASAIPVETPTADEKVTKDAERYLTQEIEEASPEVIAEPRVASRPSMAPRAAPQVTNFSETNGKVFFTNAKDGKNYVCSGAALNSGSQRLVATAGHCVHGGAGGAWHKNWAFIPAYNNGGRPYGTFAAYTMRTMNDWIAYGETARGFNSDVAFVTTNTNASNAKVVNAVGGHGLITGGNEYTFDLSLFGYPGNLNSGEVMWACWGTSGSRANGFYTFHGVSGCNFGGGASGGPWLKSYSNASGLGYIKTVSSWGPLNSTAHINGPFFRDDMRTMFNAANNDW